MALEEVYPEKKPLILGFTYLQPGTKLHIPDFTPLDRKKEEKTHGFSESQEMSVSFRTM